MHANINVPHPQGPSLPEWVPTEVITYLAHLEGGNSLRHIARKCGCHASTVLRQVRKTEGLRDDPLADAALSTLETFWRAGSAGSTDVRANNCWLRPKSPASDTSSILGVPVAT